MLPDQMSILVSKYDQIDRECEVDDVIFLPLKYLLRQIEEERIDGSNLISHSIDMAR